jgi:hypothetical protein
LAKIEKESFGYVLLVSIFIMVRNFGYFREDCFQTYYHTEFFKFVPPLWRMWANAFNSKTPKSLSRNLIFNLLRCLHV